MRKRWLAERAADAKAAAIRVTALALRSARSRLPNEETVHGFECVLDTHRGNRGKRLGERLDQRTFPAPACRRR